MRIYTRFRASVFAFLFMIMGSSIVFATVMIMNMELNGPDKDAGGRAVDISIEKVKPPPPPGLAS